MSPAPACRRDDLTEFMIPNYTPLSTKPETAARSSFDERVESKNKQEGERERERERERGGGGRIRIARSTANPKKLPCSALLRVLHPSPPPPTAAAAAHFGARLSCGVHTHAPPHSKTKQRGAPTPLAYYSKECAQRGEERRGEERSGVQFP